MPKVFISYSHDSDAHRERVRGLHASLSRDGCQCALDVYKDTDEDWPAWMTRQLIEADFVLCVATEVYERRFRDRELPDVGLGVGWEAGLIRRLLYAKKLHNGRIFPVLFNNRDRANVPLELQGYDHFLLDGKPGYEALLRKLLGRPFHGAPVVGLAPTLGATVTAPLFDRPSDSPSLASSPSSAIAVPADISQILKYAPAKLIGRENELALLNDAWDKVRQPESNRPHVLIFVALGGEGKTSLVAKWVVDEMLAKGWPGCEGVFAWSFYTQVTRDHVAASSDLFLKEALTFFAIGNDKEKEEIKTFAASSAGAHEKGQRLAKLVGQRRSLLILDGLEPLQYPFSSTAFQPGELKDQGVAKLLKDLATGSQGLCIVTTRIGLPDLKVFVGKTVREERLMRLSRQAGVDLLQKLGVQGSQRRTLSLNDGEPNGEKVNEFEKLVEDVKGHALTLTLFGGFLKRAFRGDIRKRDCVKFERADQKMDGGHAFRTMAAYEQWLLSDGGDEGRREVAVLRLMGLFDRPADADCLAALRGETVPNLTEPLAGLSDDDWDFCLNGLEDAKLLTVNRDPSGVLISLDAHPHLREYFAKQLREQNLGAWRAAHRRLYEHLCATTKEGDQPTLEDLQPLYQAVAHGCQAGLQQETCDKVYARRILRGTGSGGNYSTFILGALGSDLGAIACFFEQPWSRVSPSIAESDQAWLLNEGAFALRASGRSIESLEPSRVGLKMRIVQEDWKNAAIGASNLSELELTLGKVVEAVSDAGQSVTYADRSGDLFERMTKRTRHADSLHQAGNRAEAEKLFREAEQMQAVRQPQYPLLYSLQGFQYCDLLLAASERTAWQAILSLPSQPSTIHSLNSCRTVSERTVQTLDWWTNHFINASLLTIALDHLTLGRIALYIEILSNAEGGVRSAAWETARRELVTAVAGLRRAGQQQYLLLGLLTRAWLRFLTGAPTGPESAQEDLDEAWEIAERGPMPLFMADIHLYRARLFGSPKAKAEGIPYPWESAAKDLAEAEKLINQCGYHRRDEELADAKKAILSP